MVCVVETIRISVMVFIGVFSRAPFHEALVTITAWIVYNIKIAL